MGNVKFYWLNKSAINFMIRRIWENCNISVILGGSSEYLAYADTILLMDSFLLNW